MSNLPAIPEDLDGYGPAMLALTARQRAFVKASMNHPTANQAKLAEIAGFTGSPQSLQVTGHRVQHDEKVLAAMNEEAGKRMRTGGLIGVSAVIEIALNKTHKDHLKAALALMDRTGFHALSEHKVTVDDKRPQSKKELIDATKNVLAELGMTPAQAEKFLEGKTDDVVEAEFTEVEAEPTETAEDW